MHSSAVDSKKIFFRGAGKQHWVTFDEGDHYMPLEPSFTIKELKMHPTEAGASATPASLRPPVRPVQHAPSPPGHAPSRHRAPRHATLTAACLEQTG